MNCWHCGTELIWGGDHDLETIVNALSLGVDARLYHLLKEVKEVRDNNPDGPYKKILREEKGISI